MAKQKWSYLKADGKARGTQGWEVDKEKCGAMTYTGLWRGNKVVAILVAEGFDEGADTVHATGDMLVECANKYGDARDLLLRLADAVEALDGTSVENEKLVDDYRAFFAK